MKNMFVCPWAAYWTINSSSPEEVVCNIADDNQFLFSIAACNNRVRLYFIEKLIEYSFYIYCFTICKLVYLLILYFVRVLIG